MTLALILWIAALIVFTAIEAFSVQLLSIWFAVGALAAIAVCSLGAAPLTQIAVFVGVSALLLVFTRPLVVRLTKTPRSRTNADRVIGQTAMVTVDINNDNASGQVQVNGQFWTARSANGELFNAGDKVSVIRIEGVKVIVGSLVPAQTE